MLTIRRFLAAVAVALAMTACANGEPDGAASGAADGTPTTTIAVTTTAAVPETAVTTALPEPASSTEEETPTTVAPTVTPDPGELQVLDGDVMLPAGKYIDSFGVQNAGGEPLFWTAVGVPEAIVLKTTQGTLEPGESVPVLMTVIPESLPDGPFQLEFHISGNDTAMPVSVTGVKP